MGGGESKPTENENTLDDLQTLSSQIGRLCQASNSDATLVVQRERIEVHKCILAARSPYFSSLFDGESSSQAITTKHKGSTSDGIVELKDIPNMNSKKEFELPGVDITAFRTVLDYVYSGKYKINSKDEIQLLAVDLAHRFEMESLEALICGHLVKSIKIENFVDLYNLDSRSHTTQLENSCNDFLKGNSSELVQSDTFNKLTTESLLELLDSQNFIADEIHIFKAVEKWVRRNKPENRVIRQIIRKIRLAIISEEDLVNVVAVSKDLPSIDILQPLRSKVNKAPASTNFRK